MPKNAFFGLFFQNSACGAKNLAKIETKPWFGRARKINFVDLKKRSSKFSKFFWKSAPPPPRENPRSAPWFWEHWTSKKPLPINFKKCDFFPTILTIFFWKTCRMKIVSTKKISELHSNVSQVQQKTVLALKKNAFIQARKKNFSLVFSPFFEQFF